MTYGGSDVTEKEAVRVLELWDEYVQKVTDKVNDKQADHTRKVVQHHVNTAKSNIGYGISPEAALLTAFFKIQSDILLTTLVGFAHTS